MGLDALQQEVSQQKLVRDAAFLMGCFREVLEQSGERELAATLDGEGLGRDALAIGECDRQWPAHNRLIRCRLQRIQSRDHLICVIPRPGAIEPVSDSAIGIDDKRFSRGGQSPDH